MDPACLQHQVTEQERTTFERDGYLIVENAIPQSLVDRLVPISDRVDRQERDRMGKSPEARINHYDFIGKDDAYLELLDCPTTFPKVWGLLNWHIQLYHTHMTYTPPEPQGHSLETHGLGLGWHQDSGTLNQDLESTPRPRVSLKIAYFLTDTTQTGGAISTCCRDHTRRMTFQGGIARAWSTVGSPCVCLREQRFSSTGGCGTRAVTTSGGSRVACCSTGIRTAGCAHATT